MRANSLLRALGATALAGGLSLSVLPGAQAAAAPASGTVTFNCSMPDFGPSADFVYDADVIVEGLRDAEGSSPVTLVASLSDMPGVVPPFISMKDQDVSVKVGLDVDGTAVTLEASGKTDVNPTGDMKTKDPVVLPDNIQGTVATTGTELAVTAKSFEFVVAGVGGTCTAGAGAALGTLVPDLGAAPQPNPTPTPTPSPTSKPTPTKDPKPTKAPKDDTKGKAATAKVTFDCLLSPFNSKFDYVADVSVSAARAKEGDSDVTVAGTFGDIPGIAPVPIENGKMSVTVKGKVDGKPVTLSGTSTVNAAAKAQVPVPRLDGKVSTTAESAKVQIDSFAFAFDPMMNLEITADCKATKNADMGEMTIGVGSIDDVVDENGGGNGGGNGGAGGTSAAGGSTTLPKTGGGDAMPVIGLWALALGVLGAGLLVWMPKQRRTEV